MRIVTADQMREIEREASSEFGVESLFMMERAGVMLAHAVSRVSLENTEILILCGPGNNGGDGLAAARILDQEGHNVTALLATEPGLLAGDPLIQYRRLVESEVRLFTVGTKNYDRALGRIDDFDIIVDAILGTGAKGAPRGEILRLVEATNNAMALIVAADVPTGIDADTGLAEGSYVSANLTVSFGLPKPFLFQNEGMSAAGEWQVEDIGLPDELAVEAGNAFLLDHWWASGTFPVRTLDSHKHNTGVVLSIAGSNRYPGAAALAARGAMRAGAGLVMAAGTDFVIEGVRSHLAECPVLRLGQTEGFVSPDGVGMIKEAASQSDVIAIGPGLGRSPVVGELLRQLWTEIESKWVLDADALFWLSELDVAPRGPAIMTPHEGEAARLLKTEVVSVRRDRVGAARRIAEMFGQTVLLKGAYTVIVSPNFDVAINPTGNPGLASAGTGDVLTGVVSALLAGGIPAQAAAALGAFWHGAAADLLVERIGDEVGYLATEVADTLPSAKANIEAGLLGRTLGESDEWKDEDEIEDLEDP
ncbi:MAG: NAD(P)H-hydrate dehydratase [Fimbriimonadales bacterium]